MRKKKTIDEMLPIYKIENDCILSKRGDITIAFKLELPEIFTLSANEFEALHQAFVKGIRMLPEHTIVHKQDWFLQCTYEASFTNPDISFLSAASERYFHERPWLDHHCYLFLTKTTTGKKNVAGNATFLPGKSLPELPLNTKLTDAFLDKAHQFIKILTDCGLVSARRMQAGELASTGQQCGLLERYCFLLPDNRPLLKDIELSGNIRVGDQLCQVFSLADPEDLPPICGPRITYDKFSSDRTKFSIGFAAPLGLLLNCNHIYNQYICVDDPAATIQQLEKKRLRLQSLSAYSRENHIAKEATNAFLNEAIASQRLPVKAHFNLLTWHDNASHAKTIKNQVSAAMAQLDARCKQETVSAAQLFWAGIPGAAGELPKIELFDTFAEQAVCFLNTDTNYRSSISPQGIRLGDRLSGLPLIVDLIHEPVQRGWTQNRNFFLCAPSGAGKSFFTCHMLRSMWESGSHIVIVDVGHSYRGLCELVGGYYFTYSDTNPIRFNPFFIEGELDTEKKESIKTMLLALWKKDDEPYTRAEYVALSNALTCYYDHLSQNPDIFPCFDSFYLFLQNSFYHQLKEQGVKDKDFDIDNFLYVLRPYASGGEFDYLLNATEKLDLLSQSFLVFELDAIKDHEILLPVCTIILGQVFIAKLRQLKGVHKAIIIEEAWKAIMREGMAQYIKYLFKTVRKHFGTAGIVTQEIDDTVKSPIIKDAIINNSDIKILLDQSKYQNKFQQVQELLGLTEKDKTLILSMNKGIAPGDRYKHVTIMLGNHVTKVYRTEVSLEEYLAYTTEEKEKVRVHAYAKKYGSLQKGIAMLAAELRKAG